MRTTTLGLLLVLAMGCARMTATTGPDSLVPVVPNPRLTPGATLPVTAAEVCVPGYSSRVRHVTAATNRQVFAAYGLDPNSGNFEVDHLISLELGGSNDITNLWPESYDTQPWNAHVKDRLENTLHRLVCSGALSLTAAQTAIRSDWTQAYQRFVGTK